MVDNPRLSRPGRPVLPFLLSPEHLRFAGTLLSRSALRPRTTKESNWSTSYQAQYNILSTSKYLPTRTSKKATIAHSVGFEYAGSHSHRWKRNSKSCKLLLARCTLTKQNTKESHSLQNPCKEGANARKINTLYLNIFTSLSNIIHPFHFRDDA